MLGMVKTIFQLKKIIKIIMMLIKNFFTAINFIETLVNLKNYQKLKIIVISSIAGYFNGGAPLSYFGENSLINYSNQISKEFAKKI